MARSFRGMDISAFRRATCLLLMLVAASAAGAADQTPRHRGLDRTGGPLRLSDRLGLEANVGQAPESVDFVARTRAYTAFLDEQGALLAPHGPGSAVRISAGAAASPCAFDRRPHVVHHLRGGPDDPVRNVPCFGRVAQPDVRSGVDAAWRIRGGLLEVVLEVAPGAADERLEIRLDGTEDLAVRERVAEAQAGEGRVRLSAPVAWQEGPVGKEQVVVDYVVRGNDRLGFTVGEHDVTRRLWIDPQITYLTYFGTEDEEALESCLALDSQGRAIIAAQTYSAEFPTTDGAFQEAWGGPEGWSYSDAFVAKLSAAGDAIVWATYVGGSGGDIPHAMDVGTDDSIYIVGQTGSDDFPTYSALESEKPRSNAAAFFTRLTADGSDLVNSTYVDAGDSRAVAIGPQGRAHVSLEWDEPYFVRFAENGASIDWQYVLDMEESSLVRTRFCSIVVDDEGSLYVTGYAYQGAVGESGKLKPTPGVFQETFGGGLDTFFAKANSEGVEQWLTYFGGSHNETVRDLAIDRAGMLIAVGFTFSSDFPVTEDAEDTTLAGLQDAWIARMTPDGKALRFCRYFGAAAGREVAESVAVHPTGRIFVAGTTDDDDLPVLGAFQELDGYMTDTWVAEFSPQGNLVFASYAAGNGTDDRPRVAVDGDGALHMFAFSDSPDLPTTTSALEPDPLGDRDGFLLKVGSTLPSGWSLATTGVTLYEATRGQPYSWPFSVNGGTGPYEWRTQGAELPQGLVLESYGVVDGTPTESGTFPLVVDVTGALGVASAETTLVVNEPPVILGDGYAQWTLGVPMDSEMIVAGGTRPFVVTKTAGEPPSGTTLEPDGRLVGTPDILGWQPFEVTLVDEWDAETSRLVALRVNPPVEIITTALPDATATQPYTRLLQAVGGSGARSWTRITGQLHVDGDLVAGTGAFNGVARDPGDYAFTVRAADSVGSAFDQAYTVHVNPPPVIATTSIPIAAVGRPYSSALAVEGGTPGFAWGVADGTVPPGLRLGTTDGRLSGTPIVAGSLDVDFRCTDVWFTETTARIEVVVANRAALADSGRHIETLEEFEGAADPLPVVRYLELVAGSTLDVTVKRLVKANESPPFTIELLDGSGNAVDIAASTRVSKKAISIKKLPIATTGRYFLRLVAHRPGIGRLRLDVRVKPPKRFSAATLLDPAGDPLELRVGALDGTRLTLDVRPAKKSAARPVLASVEDAAGNDLLAAGKRKTKKGRDSLKVVVPVGGDVRIVVTSEDGGAPGEIQWSAKTKSRKGYAVEMPDLVSGN